MLSSMLRLTSAVVVSILLLPGAAGYVEDGYAEGPNPDRSEVRPAVTASQLQELLTANNYIDFARELPRAVGLTADQAKYFRGTLAYREGRFGDVVDPLVDAVRARDSALTATQKENAFEILAQTEAKTFQYGSSAKMYGDIEAIYGAQMGDGLREIQEKQHVAALLERVPAETVHVFGDFAVRRDAEGGYPMRVGGKDFSAQLDTGASISLVSESTAKRWRVKLLKGEATLHGYGGGGFAARPGVIEELQIGNAELHHVVVFVTADANLYIAEIKRQTQAVLGYPVAAALGQLTFARDGTLSVRAEVAEGRKGAPMWVGDGSLLVALGTEPVIEGDKLLGGTKERLFELDTGSGNSYLTDRYLNENRGLFKGEPPALARLAGAGGIHEIPAYQARKLPLFFGATPVLCSGQHVLTQPQGGEAESYYGVVGQDVLRLFSSYTLDFRAMRMSVVP